MIPYLNPEQAQRALQLCWSIRQPVALIGENGVGKSTLVRETVEALNARSDPSACWRLITLRLGLLAPEDLGGVPYPQDGKLHYLMPEWLPFDNEDRTVIFGDEFDRATSEVQNAFLRYLDGGEVHGHTLSRNTMIVLAVNGDSDIHTIPLSRATVTRVVCLYVSRHAAGAVETYEEWAQRNGISIVARTFVRFRQEEVFDKHEDFAELPLCKGRTVDIADRLLQASRQATFKVDDILMPVLAGVVGVRAATELLAVEKLLAEAPDPQTVLADPTGAPVPKNTSVIYALVCAVVQAVTNQQEAEAAVAYAARLPAEMAADMLRRLVAKMPSLAVTKGFQSWCRKHRAVLL